MPMYFLNALLGSLPTSRGLSPVPVLVRPMTYSGITAHFPPTGEVRGTISGLSDIALRLGEQHGHG